MRVERIRVLCEQYLAEHPELDRQAFELAWEDARPLLEAGKALELEAGSAADGESFLSTQGEALAEALLLGIVSNFLYDALRIGAAAAVRRLQDPAYRVRLGARLGQLPAEAATVAAGIAAWLEQRSAWLLQLLARNEDPPAGEDGPKAPGSPPPPA